MALDISAYSLTIVSKYASEIMNERQHVTMTYLGGERAMPNYNVMGVAKAAAMRGVRYLAYDLGEQGIRVNAVSAGPIRTLVHLRENLKQFLKRLRNVPLNVFDQLEVGNTVAFLLSDLSRAV